MNPQPLCLVNGSLEAAIEALATRSVALAHGAPRLPQPMLKVAFLQDLGRAFQGLDPTVQHALMGAGVGAGIGGVSNLFRDKEDRNIPGSMLTGALAGGALGTGLSMAQRYKPETAPQLDDHGRPALPEGQFYHPQTGKPMQWNQGAPPEAMKDVAAGQQANQSGIVDQGLRQGGNAVWNTVKNHPLTTAGGIGAAGYHALHPGGGIAARDSHNLSHLTTGLGATEPKSGPDLLKGLGAEDQHEWFKGLFRGEGLPDAARRNTGHMPGLSPEDAGQRKAVIDHLMAKGVEASAGKKLLEQGAPTLRPSLWEGIKSRVTGRPSANPHLIRGTPRSMIGGIAKTVLPLLATAGAETAAGNYWHRNQANHDMMRQIQQYAQPVE